MDFVELTNLGNLALDNLSSFSPDIAPENTSRNRSILWQGLDEAFLQLFLPYKRGFNRAVYDDGDAYRQIDLDTHETETLDGICQLSINQFMKWGFVAKSRAELGDVRRRIRRAYKLNPLQALDACTVELTGLCNLDCLHCYRGGSKAGEFGLPTEKLTASIETLFRAGLRIVHITGGEALLRKKDLMRIIEFADTLFVPSNSFYTFTYKGKEIRNKLYACIIDVSTNGTIQLDDEELARLAQLKGSVKFSVSLDSESQALTDRNRGRAGVYDLATEFIKRANSFGISASESQLYLGSAHPVPILPLGNAIRNQLGACGPYGFSDLNHTRPEGTGWCKGFTTPDTIYVRPTGIVSNCLYGYGSLNGWGNLQYSSIADVLNNMQFSRVFGMWSDGSIEKYAKEIDTRIFGRHFMRTCIPAIITTAYGERKEFLLAQGVPEGQARIIANRQAAKVYGYL